MNIYSTLLHLPRYCTITSDAKIERQIDNRSEKEKSTFGRLDKCMWKNKQLKKGDTKVSVYGAIVLTTLVNGSESQVPYCQHLQLLECTYQHCLHTILNIH